MSVASFKATFYLVGGHVINCQVAINDVLLLDKWKQAEGIIELQSRAVGSNSIYIRQEHIVARGIYRDDQEEPRRRVIIWNANGDMYDEV